jgi:hypothetical protein
VGSPYGRFACAAWHGLPHGLSVRCAGVRARPEVGHLEWYPLRSDVEPHYVDLAWMPAHTDPDDVGHLLLSDGTALTVTDRKANGEADLLAKMAEAELRVPVLSGIWLEMLVPGHGS